MLCAVTADLNRHQTNQDQQNATSEAVDMLAAQWLSHPSKVKKAWSEILQDHNQTQDVISLLTHYSLKSGRFLGMDEATTDSLLSVCLADMLESQMKDLAHDHLESEAEQNQIDAALSARED